MTPDLAIYTALEDTRSEFRSGAHVRPSDGVGLAYSGFIDDIRPDGGPEDEDHRGRSRCRFPDRVDDALERDLTETACSQDP
jgi:hypothetical protein